MKAYAETNWKRLNNTTPLDKHEFRLETYDIDESAIFLETEISKFQPEDRKIFDMRKEGYTFNEIAAETSFENLHKVRNRFLELCEKIEAA